MTGEKSGTDELLGALAGLTGAGRIFQSCHPIGNAFSRAAALAASLNEYSFHYR
ncbi:hypothetical protein [Mycolicibacterium sp.]|uniref:hypothetical protein n=1 Tax=Mycolicibacterium sp. TaxID=2320850 RepID=UPI0025DA5CBA|nr:hypothetical protein [Mycolicibacterium sp.]